MVAELPYLASTGYLRFVVPRYAMAREFEKRLEKVLDEIEKAPDEQLAAEVKAYRESLKECEFEGPGLGKIALQAGAPGTDPRLGRFVVLDDNNGGG